MYVYTQLIHVTKYNVVFYKIKLKLFFVKLYFDLKSQFYVV